MLETEIELIVVFWLPIGFKAVDFITSVNEGNFV